MSKTCTDLVLGGGVSGLSAAYALSKPGDRQVVVLERGSAIGGQCSTQVRDGRRYDSGSHRIHDKPDPKAFALIRELCGDDVVLRERGGHLRIGKGYIDYPITSFKMFLGLGLTESFKCGLSLMKARLQSAVFGGVDESELNYESHLMQKAGRRGYRIFYEPYARKVWACEPRRISMTAVKKRISMTKPTQIISDMLRHALGRSEPQHYYYIKNGVGRIPEMLGKSVEAQGGIIRRQSHPTRLERRPDGWLVTVATPDGEETIQCQHVISTIPLRELLALTGLESQLTCAPDQLRWRGLRFACLHIAGEPLLDGETFYYPELRFCFGRVSVPVRYSSSMLPDFPDFTSIICEVPCSPGDALWELPERDFLDMCFEGLVAADFVAADQRLPSEMDFVMCIEETYPLYFTGWREAFDEALGLLAEAAPGIYTCGKMGLYLHCNLDHAMRIGLELADHIRARGDGTAWHVRAD
ncbi:MAG: FAD-dependent oxidoreductase, partial [Verrucomicrobia bacterium]|nr:FAD-dependent oxidoreductase [Verrucomicrobiota bacterium]